METSRSIAIAVARMKCYTATCVFAYDRSVLQIIMKISAFLNKKNTHVFQFLDSSLVHANPPLPPLADMLIGWVVHKGWAMSQFSTSFVKTNPQTHEEEEELSAVDEAWVWSLWQH